MGNMNIVTGYTGSAHVKASDQGSLNAALFGDGEYVLNRGQELSASAISSNTVRVLDGDIMFQGRHIRIDDGSYIDLTIDSGTAGYKRNDLIVCRYTRDGSTGVEAASLVVIKGTPVSSSGTASDPAYTEGDIINDHDLLADMPLYRVSLDGINIGTLVPLFSQVSGSVPLSRTIAGLGLSQDITVAQLLQALSAYYVGGNDVAVSDGGTGASTAAGARNNLGINLANLGAAPAIHATAHGSTGNDPISPSDIGALPASGGSVSGALTIGGKMTANGSVVLKSDVTYGTSLPTSGTEGQLFFLRE